ncbi:hypothetical protein NM688_g4266 [Phlebia brevispora]|uniref:Uncharacterized protein n=1 Tax=Phlebia brevispora TaxID=194682 RepID=A0ACC1T359_9APHY|nr:hypothetical protein NM688_g4266 [Phlebia brevispora]
MNFAQPAPAAQPAAQPRLFLPTRLFTSAGSVAFNPNESPVSAQEGRQFPFDVPPCLTQSRNVSGAEIRTLWENLKRYSDDRSVGVNGWTTWSWATATQPPLIPLADRFEQAKAAYGIAGWYTEHFNADSTILVNCEPAVQDEVRSQIIVPLNWLIKSRYQNFAHKPLTTDQSGARLKWRGDEKKSSTLPSGVHLPKWSRAPHAAHPSQGLARRKAAGFPDYVRYPTTTQGPPPEGAADH